MGSKKIRTAELIICHRVRRLSPEQRPVFSCFIRIIRALRGLLFVESSEKCQKVQGKKLRTEGSYLFALILLLTRR
jgi:hypothetical protein